MPLLRRAQIHREGGDVTMAIVNYTQAIKLDPEDYEAYYQRAEMYEKVILLYVCVCVCVMLVQALKISKHFKSLPLYNILCIER